MYFLQYSHWGPRFASFSQKNNFSPQILDLSKVLIVGISLEETT